MKVHNLAAIGSVSCLIATPVVAAAPAEPPCVSGVYPHLAVFNSQERDGETRGSGGECGIGAVVPWAGRLWLLTYSPHCPQGSPDKLFAIDADLRQEIRPESIGGTPAGRLIHRESQQLFIGPYAIDATGVVRVIPYSAMSGRHTAIARHLTDPANRLYYFDMEGRIYEVDVHTLAVNLLFRKPVPGWHGKGGYTGQGRYVIANNGEGAVGGHSYADLLVGGPAQGPEEVGVLAEWDGSTWRIVERRQFTEVTGPGGILGAPADNSPLWAVGWDRRSVILKLCDAGRWQTFRLPKGSHTYDGRGGWYTEWPRIREIAPGRLMLDMHALFWDFPAGFRAGHSAGLRPIATHHRYVPDFCHWNGRVVLASDDTSIMNNPMAGQSQSNLWFGTPDQIREWGPRAGWGGPWLQDAVSAGTPSDPFAIGGFARRCLHLASGLPSDLGGRVVMPEPPALAAAEAGARITLEVDRAGSGQWEALQALDLPAGGYRYCLLPSDLQAEWLRVVADRDAQLTAYLHLGDAGRPTVHDPALFASLALPADETCTGAWIRPAAHNRNLQVLVRTPNAAGEVAESYLEVDEALRFSTPAASRAQEVHDVAAVKPLISVDAASVIVRDRGVRYRLPKGDGRYDRPFASGWPRALRECESERLLLNAHGTFYEVPLEAGMARLKPMATHGRQILDFCTWRGLLVLAGVRADAPADGHCFRAPGPAGVGLWFGAIDDLWKLGKPVGQGGPWHETAVQAGEASDPYLMTHYDRKRVELSHDAATAVTFTLEVDVDHCGWRVYDRFTVPAGQTVAHAFPEGYGAHWARLRSSVACRATAWFTYE